MKIKFNRLLVSIIGIVLLIGIGCLMWFLVIKPAKESLQAKEAEYEPLKQYNEELLISTQQNKIEEFKKADMAEDLYNSYMNRYMPMLDFGRREMGMVEYWREYKNIEKVLKNFADDPNLTTSISLTVPQPPTNPNDSFFDQDYFTYTGQVTVTGDFLSILDNITRWSQAPRLVLVNANSIDMKMSGDDPNLITATYGITCYVIPWQKGGEKIKMATGGATASPDAMGGAMGAPGMPPTGGPGMPGAPVAGTMPAGAPTGAPMPAGGAPAPSSN